MNTKQRNEQRNKLLLIALLDCIVLACSGGMAILARFDFTFSAIHDWVLEGWIKILPIQCVIFLAVFIWRKMYHYVWRTVSAYDVANMCLSVVIAYVLSMLCVLVLQIRMPRSFFFIQLACLLMGQVGMRCILRFYVIFNRKLGKNNAEDRIMIIGAGQAGRMLLNEAETSRKITGKICCLIDDNPKKKGRHLNGVPIVGGREAILDTVERYAITQIILAIPSLSGAARRDILNICKLTKCKISTIPGFYQMVNGDVAVTDIKSIQIEDLLGREPVKLDMDMVGGFLRDKVVMVTGGGGSIGSELCRQIARFAPKQLIIFENYENNAYEIQQELIRAYGSALDLRLEIASVRDKMRTYEIVKSYRPDIIFHAAAHKHVPLMEACPSEAIKNNVFGTYHVVRAAEKFGVGKFVMISTDKAVNPTNFMGATKRFCEMILQSRGESTTEFCAVRFGNVLGSNGSVIPLFKKQIENGGPVTITDKRIIRYFMTIPEAAQLVLEAGAMAKQNQVFVLDMGEPVKILDLAENLIRLSGLVPYKDIEITEIGLRPGEKLYEELLMNNEHLLKTANEKIFVEEQCRIVSEEIMNDLIRLDEAVTRGVSREDLIEMMKSMVPTYRSPEEINELVTV